jgi:hypothetical protein
MVRLSEVGEVRWHGESVRDGLPFALRRRAARDMARFKCAAAAVR